jgi:hypothetical protein
MYITVINDCQSENEVARQETRLVSLFSNPVTFVGLNSNLDDIATFEAAGTLIDVLDAAEDREGIILLNSAPRGEQQKDGNNGTAFCYFHYKHTLVISTLRGLSLSLAKKFNVTQSLCVVDPKAVCRKAFEAGMISKELADYIPVSQFRSFDFTPRLAYWLHTGMELPFTRMDINEVDTMPDCVWYVDAFGNCKTSLLPSDVAAQPGSRVNTNLGEFMFYPRLIDIPKGETAIYIGSSGIEGVRMLELATQKQTGSAAKTLGIGVGHEIKVL